MIWNLLYAPRIFSNFQIKLDFSFMMTFIAQRLDGKEYLIIPILVICYFTWKDKILI